MSWLGTNVIELAECGSTNDEAARLARAGARHGTVVTAARQTAGRGRDGRAWASPPGFGLYVSAIVRPPLPLVDVPPMTLAIGIGVCEAARAFGAPAQLKWPNDLLVGDHKLAGVLVEAQSQGSKVEAVIVGIGLNLGGAVPPEVARTATTLVAAARAAGRAPLDPDADDAALARELRAPVLAKLLAHVAYWIDRYIASGLPAIVPAWTERMARGLVARAIVDRLAITGELVGIAPDGAVLVQEIDGDAAGRIHRVRSGDVELVRGRTLPHDPAATPARVW